MKDRRSVRQSLRRNLAYPKTRRSEPTASVLSTALKFGALPLTVISLVLTLLSYGYVLGLLDAFHAAPEQLQLSALDYLQRSYRPLLVGLQIVSEKASFTALWNWVEDLWWRTWPIPFALSAIFVVMIYLAANDLSMSERAQRLAGLAATWNRFVRARLLAFSMPMLTIGTALLMFAAIGVGIWVSFAPFLALVFLIPAMSISSGLTAARANILQPAGCSSPAISIKNVSGGARCIRVLRDGKEVARGRYVEQGPNRVLLYRKSSDTLLSVPLEASILEDVASE